MEEDSAQNIVVVKCRKMSDDDFKAKKLKEDENRTKGKLLTTLNPFKNFGQD